MVIDPAWCAFLPGHNKRAVSVSHPARDPAYIASCCICLQRLYECGETEGNALLSLLGAIPTIQAWQSAFRGPGPGFSGTDIDAGHLGKTRLAVSDVHSVEDKMCSPMWGLKGVLDMTVDVVTRPVQGTLSTTGGLQRYDSLLRAVVCVSATTSAT